MTTAAVGTDTDLIRAAGRGDAAALGRLFRDHWPGVHRLASTMVGDRAAADDIAQDVFERAFRGLGRFDGRSSFETWVHRIAVNRSIDHLRRRRPTIPLDQAPDAAAEDAVSDAFLRAAVLRLAPERRAVVVLRFWLDRTVPEIAALLDVPEGTARSRLARAMDDLRASMTEVPT